MEPRIVSWGRNEDSEWVAPVVSSAGTASVVSIESLISALHTTPNPSITSGTSRARLTGSRSRPASFLGIESAEGETPAGSRWQNGDPFLRRSKYFFGDGNVTFLIDGFLYCVHRYFFSRDSVYFSTRFAQLGVRDHEALSTIISLGDVERKDFEAFLSVLYPENFEVHDLSYEQWRSVLHLSTRWSFASLRKLALTSIKPPSAYDRLLLARKYAVDHWVIPALTALCLRTAPLSLDEARGIGMEDVVLVATVREEIRGKEVRTGVSPTEISRRVLEVMQAGTPIPVEGNEVPPAAPASGSTEQRPGSTSNATVGPSLEARSRNDMETAGTEPVKDNTPMSGWNLVTPSPESQGKNVEQEAKVQQAPTGARDDVCDPPIKTKKKKGKPKTATNGLFPGISTWGGAGSSARTDSEDPRKQGFLDGQSSEAPVPQAVEILPQPPATYHNPFASMFGNVTNPSSFNGSL